MTNQKHLKSRVRERMAKTGERYAAARSAVVGAEDPQPAPERTGHAAQHLAGSTRKRRPSAFLRVRRSGTDVSEAFALVAAGGIGAGAFAFHYPQFSSLYLTGRHKLDDSAGFVATGLARLGVEVSDRPDDERAAARRHLVAALERGPAIAWCDFVELGRAGCPELVGRRLPPRHRLRARSGRRPATIGDLRRDPERIDAERFARARGRITKDKTRVVGIASSSEADLAAATRAGLAAASTDSVTRARGASGSGRGRRWRVECEREPARTPGSRRSRAAAGCGSRCARSTSTSKQIEPVAA